MQKIERIRSDNCLREWGSCLNRDVSRNCRVSSQKERERESSGIGRVTSCVMLIAGWDVRERRRRKWDARSRRWAVTRERVWWPASQQQQPRCSVAHAHLNYISSGETLRKENRVRRPEGKQREREREGLCDPFILQFSRASSCYKSRTTPPPLLVVVLLLLPFGIW